MSEAAAPALSIEGLCVEYPRVGAGPLRAVDGVNLAVSAGMIHALVGESGAGKSTVGSAVLGILDAPGRVTAGAIRIVGALVDPATGRAPGIEPGRDIGAIFQDPMTSLNPLFTVESQLGEGMRHHLGLSRADARARSIELLNAVGIPEPERRLRSYPHQLSGGQRQRVVIASALSCRPKLIIADEPSTALDISTQAQILALLRRLTDENGVGVLLVTHNIGVVAEVADQVTIMRNGRVVESGSTQQVLLRPRDHYARDLIASVPPIDRKLERFATPDEGEARGVAARAKIAARVGNSGGSGAPLLSIEQITVDYALKSTLFRRDGAFRAVDDVSLTLRSGEILGLVGESGSGKSTVANVIAGLVKPQSGRVLLRGRVIAGEGARLLPREEKRQAQMIFQDPYSSLNPRLRVAATLAEPILFYRLVRSKAEAEADVAILLDAVGLEPAFGQRYPHAFSGGQRQRVSIARALSAQPTILICDEPTSSLDVSVQARVLNLLKDLRDASGLAMLFISHDLAVVRQMCDRVAVMKDGKIRELAETETLFAHPKDPYTRELIHLAPRLDAIERRGAATI